MDQQGHRIDQKGLKMYEKRQKIEFSDLNKIKCVKKAKNRVFRPKTK